MATLTLAIEVEAVSGFQCNECQHIASEDDITSPLYECGGCGTRFTRENSADGSGSRCPDCNKFAAKVATEGCPECNAGEMESVDGFKCPACDDIHDADTIAEHVGECLSLTLVDGSSITEDEPVASS